MKLLNDEIYSATDLLTDENILMTNISPLAKFLYLWTLTTFRALKNKIQTTTIFTLLTSGH